jgi:hypothetical protein
VARRLVFAKIRMRHETLDGYRGCLTTALFQWEKCSFVGVGSLLAHNRRLDREVVAGEAERLAAGPVHASRVDVARADEGSEG